jgi:hypothetical protein
MHPGNKKMRKETRPKKWRREMAGEDQGVKSSGK